MKEMSKDSDLEKLTDILSSVRELYYKKKEQLEDLKLEIEKIKDVLNQLNSMVSNKSFHGADEIYQSKTIGFTKENIEEYVEDKNNNKGSKLKRKIFSKNRESLVCVLSFTDFKTIEIKFLNPNDLMIKETLDKFINIFLKGALIQIKENNPELDLHYSYYKNSDIIEAILIKNVNSMDDYDLITDKVEDLLASLK
ncbi:MAG: hypothetical protein GF353_06565 [Candidatus Lokiarchaeota archaeon]|nr:hypothetical protein [Candidatus Lokiarchaeota archaeon]